MADDAHPIPVKIRTARKQHTCDDCLQPISPGERYELAVYPPHRIAEYDLDRWVSWRTHYPRHDDQGRFLFGCDLSAAYRENSRRTCRECGGTGAVDVDRCTCGAGPGSYAGMHERYCGLEPCPAGCEFKPPALAGT